MMKNLLIAVATLLTLFSCSGNREGKTVKFEGITFDSLSVDTVVPLTEKAGAPRLELRLAITYVKGRNADRINRVFLRSGILSPDYLSLSQAPMTVKEAVDSFVHSYARDYKKDYSAIFRQDPTHPASLNNRYELHTWVESQADNVLTCIGEVHYYGGGEHPIRQTLARNFEVKTGKLITLNDLFVPGYQQGLEEIVRKELMKKYKVDDWKPLAERYFFAGEKIYVPDNFILSDDAITFIYCEDEIVPHAEGEIRLTIDKDDLKKWLK